MPLLFTAFLCAVMQLLQHRFQFLRDRQAEVRGVLYEADAFIGQIKKMIAVRKTPTEPST